LIKTKDLAVMKKKVFRSTVNIDAKLPKTLSPDDALKFKLAVATRSIAKKEKSSLFANFIKKQIKSDLK
tara:strand:+ start:706 stop:912 length:207 start_codon:yes stop_codon:yes gene_type:complete